MLILILLAGFAVLIIGADQLVKGASSVAAKFGISSLIIGLTIVAFGSSAPELVVNILASVNNSQELALGNIMGSNIANILLILGISAIIRPLAVRRTTVFREIPFAILGMIVLTAMVSDIALGGTINEISRSEGIALLGFFSIFLFYTFAMAKANRQIKETKTEKKKDEIPEYTKIRSAIMVVSGLAGLLIGGHLIVSSAVEIAQIFGVSEALIALTVVAIGTSLPELAASGMAAYRGNVDLAVGNVIGSNIFNTLWILGISTVIMPMPITDGGMVDVIIALSVSALLIPFLRNIGKKHELERWQGILFVLIYIAFIVFSVWRG